MSLTTPKLDTLPVEIIHRIAVSGACEATIALLRINRALRTACNDRALFRAIIDDANSTTHGRTQWRSGILSNDSPVGTWVRYALANAKASSYGGGDCGGMPPDFIRWGPQLVTSQHPLANRLNVAGLLASIRKAEPLEAQALGFCLAVRFLSHDNADLFENSRAPYGAPMLHGQPGTSGALNLTRNELLLVFKLPLYNYAEAPLVSPENQEMVITKHATANRAAGIFNRELQTAMHANRIPTFRNVPAVPAASVVPPAVSNIPLFSVMDAPSPFPSKADGTFGMRHLRLMTSCKFLEEGEWAGYYCYSRDLRGTDANLQVHFDQPMHGIRFSTSTQIDDPTTLEVYATGMDDLDGFHLTGEISSQTGRVILRKRYAHGVVWDYFGLMTPFGIVGSWGRDSWGGWFWLWPVAWSEGS